MARRCAPREESPARAPLRSGLCWRPAGVPVRSAGSQVARALPAGLVPSAAGRSWQPGSHTASSAASGSKRVGASSATFRSCRLPDREACTRRGLSSALRPATGREAAVVSSVGPSASATVIGMVSGEGLTPFPWFPALPERFLKPSRGLFRHSPLGSREPSSLVTDFLARFRIFSNKGSRTASKARGPGAHWQTVPRLTPWEPHARARAARRAPVRALGRRGVLRLVRRRQWRRAPRLDTGGTQARSPRPTPRALWRRRRGWWSWMSSGRASFRRSAPGRARGSSFTTSRLALPALCSCPLTSARVRRGTPRALPRTSPGTRRLRLR